MADQTINLPQLLLILLLGALAIRYFFFSPGSATGQRQTSSLSGAASSASNRLRAREADVERIQQMFPQVSRRTIMWDLQRNGGNVVATTERVLSGRGLEEPPQSFQPPLPVPSTASTESSTTSTPAPSKALQPDLITRYNLKAKIASRQLEEESEGAPPAEKEKGNEQAPSAGWSQNKAERQALLQRRREEMILAARRKMEAKVKCEVASGRVGAGAEAGIGT